MRPIRKTSYYILMRKGNKVRIFCCDKKASVACSPFLPPAIIKEKKLLTCPIPEFNVICRSLCTMRINDEHEYQDTVVSPPPG